MNRIDEIIYEETQKAAYEEQCLYDFIHQEQPNEDYFEGINDYIDETRRINYVTFYYISIYKRKREIS